MRRYYDRRLYLNVGSSDVPGPCGPDTPVPAVLPPLPELPSLVVVVSKTLARPRQLVPLTVITFKVKEQFVCKQPVTNFSTTQKQGRSNAA